MNFRWGVLMKAASRLQRRPLVWMAVAACVGLSSVADSFAQCPPFQPILAIDTGQQCDHFHLSWSVVLNIDYYSVQQSYTPQVESSWAPAVGGGTVYNTYLDVPRSSLEVGNTVYFRVQAASLGMSCTEYSNYAFANVPQLA